MTGTDRPVTVETCAREPGDLFPRPPLETVPPWDTFPHGSFPAGAVAASTWAMIS